MWVWVYIVLRAGGCRHNNSEVQCAKPTVTGDMYVRIYAVQCNARDVCWGQHQEAVALVVLAVAMVAVVRAGAGVSLCVSRLPVYHTWSPASLRWLR